MSSERKIRHKIIQPDNEAEEAALNMTVAEEGHRNVTYKYKSPQLTWGLRREEIQTT